MGARVEEPAAYFGGFLIVLTGRFVQEDIKN
jgi:hypothetical protein